MPGDTSQFQTLISLGGRLITLIPPHLIGADQTGHEINSDPFITGRCRKRKGYTIHGIALPSPTGTGISGLYKWRGFADPVATEGTKIYTVSGSGWTDRTPGGSVFSQGASRSSFEHMKGLLVVVNPGISPLKWDGITATFLALGGSPPANVNCITGFKDRLFMANASGNESRVYHSAVNDPEDWTSVDNAGNFDVYPDGKDTIQQIVGGRNFIWVVKDDTVYVVRFNSALDFSILPLGLGFGGVSRHGALEWNGSLIVATPTGVWQITMNSLTELTSAIRDKYTAIADKTTIQLIVDQNSLLYIFYDSNNDGAVDEAYVVNLPDGRMSRWTNMPWRVATIDPANGTLYAGHETAAKLFKLNTGTTDDGTAITLERDTPHLLVSGGFERERGVPLAIVVARSFGASSGNLTLRIIKNGVLQSTSYTVSTVGTDGETVRVPVRLPLERYQTIGFRLSQAGSGEDAEILAVAVDGLPFSARGKLK